MKSCEIPKIQACGKEGGSLEMQYLSTAASLRLKYVRDRDSEMLKYVCLENMSGKYFENVFECLKHTSDSKFENMSKMWVMIFACYS